jgi:hypothetical protein
MNRVAQRYVKLVLAVGQHDADYVDAYYGPPEWKTEAQAGKRPLPEIRAEAQSLLGEIARLPAAAAGEDEFAALRLKYLTRQLESLAARVEMLSGRKMSFDEESKTLYDAVAPPVSEEDLRTVNEELSRLLPGTGPLATRYDAFREKFIITREKLGAVFTAAIEAARERTKAHITLPPGENFTVDYVTGKSWGAYNWYQGNFRSLIQVNTDVPIYIDRALDLACHEGYPGHHVYNVLLEKNLVRDRGWIEFTVYPLLSPQSLIAEGSANFGIEVAFPEKERADFERKVLFALAGLDTSLVERYEAMLKLTERLTCARNEAARRYLNGQIDRAAAAAWLVQYAATPPARAEKQVRFIEQYRSYVINYSLGKDLVRRYIEGNGGSGVNPEVRWREFARLLSSPRLPSGLAVK